jgi:hypothetical protein
MYKTVKDSELKKKYRNLSKEQNLVFVGFTYNRKEEEKEKKNKIPSINDIFK